jgi:hypothetical protein
MSKRGRAGSRNKSASSEAEDEFVLVSPSDASAAPSGSAEENEEYQRKLDTAYKADLLGIELPPVAPPGHHLQPVIEKPKVTFWTLLFRSDR